MSKTKTTEKKMRPTEGWTRFARNIKVERNILFSMNSASTFRWFFSCFKRRTPNKRCERSECNQKREKYFLFLEFQASTHRWYFLFACENASHFELIGAENGKKHQKRMSWSQNLNLWTVFTTNQDKKPSKWRKSSVFRTRKTLLLLQQLLH